MGLGLLTGLGFFPALPFGFLLLLLGFLAETSLLLNPASIKVGGQHGYGTSWYGYGWAYYLECPSQLHSAALRPMASSNCGMPK